MLGLVSDPFADDMPPGLKIVVSDGELQAEIDTADRAAHRRLDEMAKGRLAQVLDWQRRFGIPVLPVSSAEDSLRQMRRLMGLAGQAR